jgi:hypothetical protein
MNIKMQLALSLCTVSKLSSKYSLDNDINSDTIYKWLNLRIYCCR